MKNPNDKRSDDTNALIDKCKIFFAFSNEQFSEGKKKIGLQEGEKLVDIGAGGFMPKKYTDTYITGMKAIDEEFRKAMKDQKARLLHIKYQLNNHEAYYSRDISSTLEALGDGFTREEVQKVFKGR